MKRRMWAALAVLPLVAVGACGNGGSGGSSASDSSSKVFDVVFVSGLSGPLEPVAGPMAAAFKASAADLNAHGGILGRKIKIETLDGHGDPTKSVNVLQKRISSGDKPDLIYAGVASAEVLAMLPVAARAGIPSVASGSSNDINDIKAYPLHRNIIPSAASQMLGLTKYVGDRSVKKLVVLAPQDAQGDGIVAAAKKLLAGSGVDIVNQRYSTTDVDVSVAWEKAAAAHPDAIYTDCLGDPCGRLLQGRLKAGITDIPTLGGTSLGGSGNGPASFAPAAALKNLDMMVFGAQVKRATETASMKAFLTGFKKQYGKITSTVAPASSWDGLRMYAMAAKKANSTDPAKMVEAISAGLDAPSDYFLLSTDLKFPADKTMQVPPVDTFKIIPATSTISDGQYEVSGN
jgi:branched-chain amino acid transport system substrate-binding protein